MGGWYLQFHLNMVLTGVKAQLMDTVQEGILIVPHNITSLDVSGSMRP